ncbi:hypothetical protein M5361_08865 [Ligilactobacillus agilis]|nr:hypothetical protein [Ligilactobacillus agilis]
MIIDANKIELLLSNKNLTDYQIEKMTRVSRVTVKQYRQNGINSMKLVNAVKLLDGYKQMKKIQ